MANGRYGQDEKNKSYHKKQQGAWHSDGDAAKQVRRALVTNTRGGSDCTGNSKDPQLCHTPGTGVQIPAHCTQAAISTICMSETEHSQLLYYTLVSSKEKQKPRIYDELVPQVSGKVTGGWGLICTCSILHSS